MSNPQDYALLSADAYRDARSLPDNYAPIPLGWTELKQYAVSGSGETAPVGGNGFSARVYKNASSGEIVISYAGTQFGGSSAGQRGDWLDGNVPLGAGLNASQAVDSAELYQRVYSAEGTNITFTGHSLGGGLAAMMAVYFNRPAKVFAPAPFRDSATSIQDILGSLGPLANIRLKLYDNAERSGLLSKLFIPPELLSYNPDRDYATRSTNVQPWAVKGEVLELMISWVGFIEQAGSRKSLLDAGNTELAFLAKHSIDLHAAALMSPTFNEWAAKLPSALPLMFKEGFYFSNLISGDKPDFLVKLLEN